MKFHPYESFIKHYWSAFLWIGLAGLTVLLVIIVTIMPTNTPQFHIYGALLLMTGFGGAAISTYKNGFRIEQDVIGVSFGGLLQPLKQAVCWPFYETSRQINFLLKARQAWTRGEILFDDFGREALSG